LFSKYNASIRGYFQEGERIADIPHREQAVDPQRDEARIKRFADRHARL